MIFSGRNDPANRFKKMDGSALNLDIKVQRAVACLMGLAICDAFGSCTEF